MKELFYFLLVLGGLYWLRILILSRRTQARNHEAFEGKLYQVDRCAVGYLPQANAPQTTAPQKRVQKADATIVCMHGWLEDQRYFTQTYSNENAELIFINSSDYHVPFQPAAAVVEPWCTIIGYPPHTIEYDAAVLIRAVENLATGKTLRLHGHSRGGAVVLEALKQNPDLFRDAEIILEAPILPEATIVTQRFSDEQLNMRLARFFLFLFPYVAFLLNKFGLPEIVKKGMGPGPARKRTIVDGLFFSPKRIEVLVNNIRNMQDWPLRNTVELYDLASRGAFLIPAWDNVLSRRRMVASANRNKGNLQVLETEGTSHFVTIDDPELLKGLPLQARWDSKKGSNGSLKKSQKETAG